MTRDAIAGAMRRLHSTELANATVGVLMPDVGYEVGKGWDVEYPDVATITLKARLESPSSNPESSRSGTTAEEDLVIRVRDDAGPDGWGTQEWGRSAWGSPFVSPLDWTGYGEDADAPVRVVADPGQGWGDDAWSSEWADERAVYEVTDAHQQRNGLLKLTAKEV